MLIQFSVKNWRSVRDEQILSLVKAKGEELADTNSFTPDTPHCSDLLRSAAIYGANAAGKSNLLSALRVMKDIVLESANKQPGDELPVIAFKLDRDSEKLPTEFEMTFIVDKVKYQYGFTASATQIFDEWLIAYPNGRPQKWFTRAFDLDTKEYNWSTGPSLQGQKQVWQETTRSNALFLSTATQLNSKQLRPVLNWFRNTLRVSSVVGWHGTYTASVCKDLDQKAKVLNFLKAADFDIKDLKIKAEVISTSHLPDSMPEEIKQKFLEEMKGEEIYDIKTVHEGAQGQLIDFDFDDESDGTQKLFSFAGPWLDVLEHGRVLFVDELHDNLHPKLVSFLVNLFHNKKSNPHNAQLVFTTHETSILSQEVFRRDQIWFCEKDTKQATKLYPLSDFSPRKGRENLEEAYLAGRYGALPYTRPYQVAGL
ncbi:AAA family ATPase [Pseudomonas congelans]|uniref:AAA family ATPase n=1 Tax=Pseudomonas congelans TaxID=200452 RepID=UPI001655F57E|nr:ATP-binding protein [Pseudomonas congelans]MBC8801193.1 ATP-binding protein [Pseudomonas congelans]